MKKILILFIFLVGCAKPVYKAERHLNTPFHDIFVGTTANDGTGDDLRTAFTQVNTTFGAIADSLAERWDSVQVSNAISDTISAVKAAAKDINDYLDDFSGGGSGYNRYDLSGKVDDDGFPDTGDSTITNDGFKGRTVQFFREGLYQQQHDDNTVSDGYWFDQDSGMLTVRPVFGAGEQIIVQAFEPINVTQLTPQGNPSALLDSLKLFYKMDETSGTIMYDALGVNNGVNTATVNAIGINGKCYHYDTNTDDSYVNYSASLVPTGAIFTVAMWVYLDELPSYNYYIAAFKTTDAYYWTHLFYFDTNAALHFNVYNSSHDLYESNTANSVVTTGQWYHVAGVVDGTNALKIYVNGAEVSTVHPAFSGTFAALDSRIQIFNSPTGTQGTLGYCDDFGYWNRALSDAEILILYGGKTYPFN